MRRLLLSAVFAALLVPGWLVLGASPAAPCSCAGAPGTPMGYAAEVVLSGQIIDRREVDQTATYTIAVDRVYRGSATSYQQVVTPAHGGSCGLELPSTGPVLLLAGTRADPFGTKPAPGQLVAGLCGGSSATDVIPAVLGPGRAPIRPRAPAGPDAGG